MRASTLKSLNDCELRTLQRFQEQMIAKRQEGKKFGSMKFWCYSWSIHNKKKLASDSDEIQRALGQEK